MTRLGDALWVLAVVGCLWYTTGSSWLVLALITLVAMLVNSWSDRWMTKKMEQMMKQREEEAAQKLREMFSMEQTPTELTDTPK